MAAAIAAVADEAAWRAAGQAAHEQATDRFALKRVCESWHRLLTTDLEPAVPGPLLELLGSH